MRNGLRKILSESVNTNFEVKGNGNSLCELYEVEFGRLKYIGTYNKEYLVRVWRDVYGYRKKIHD